MRSLLLGLLFVACAPAPRTPATPSIQPLPDFALVDVNPGSPTAGQTVGPSALRGKVTGWYFTHSG